MLGATRSLHDGCSALSSDVHFQVAVNDDLYKTYILLGDAGVPLPTPRTCTRARTQTRTLTRTKAPQPDPGHLLAPEASAIG